MNKTVETERKVSKTQQKINDAIDAAKGQEDFLAEWRDDKIQVDEKTRDIKSLEKAISDIAEIMDFSKNETKSEDGSKVTATLRLPDHTFQVTKTAVTAITTYLADAIEAHPALADLLKPFTSYAPPAPPKRVVDVEAAMKDETVAALLASFRKKETTITYRETLNPK